MKSNVLNILRESAMRQSVFNDGHPYLGIKHNSPYMPFYFEMIGPETWAMAHWGTMNGDMMVDPEVVLKFNSDDNQWTPLNFRNDYMGVNQELTTSKRITDVEQFLRSTWLPNLEQQGFVDIAKDMGVFWQIADNIQEAKKIKEDLSELPRRKQRGFLVRRAA